MNKNAIYHEPESNYCFPLDEKTIILRLRVDRNDIFQKVKVLYGDKYTYYKKQKNIEMSLKYQDLLFSYYEVKIKLLDVRFVYIFELENNGLNYFYHEEGLTLEYDFSKAFYNCFQFPYINKIDIPHEIKWLENSVLYQIFVDRFNIGKKEKDRSYINMKWLDKPKSKSFAGGDILGIIEKIPYLKSLGVNLIYLTPVFSAISNHKYDINDYYKIDPMFGEEKDLKELINLLHKNNMRIILDGVFNHTSSLIMQFQDVVKNGKNSPYFNWFLINDDFVNNKSPNYETFSHCAYLPKLNTSNVEVQNFLIEIGKYYVNEYHIDGWRLDVSDEVSHSFWRKFNEELKNISKDILLLGENWHNASSFLKGDQLDSIINYGFTKTMLDYICYDASNADDTSNKLNNLLIRYKDQTNKMMVNMLDSHDTNRFYSETKKDKDKLLLGLAITFQFIGVPGIFAGIECPLEGGYDPDNRRCVDWSLINNSNDYLNKLKSIIKIRKEKVIIEGDISVFAINDLLIIDRYTKKNRIRLIANNSGKSKNLSLENYEVILENRMEQGNLLDKGFVIMRAKV
ncbi:MAG: glycoside hydrolase family 13 protein [Bacilli bacterium]